jgi:hypothetical protein
MSWMPVVFEENAKGSDVVIGSIVAIGIIVMVVVGIPWLRSFLYSVPVALVIALGLRYWHSRHKVDLISLGYKDHSNRD